MSEKNIVVRKLGDTEGDCTDWERADALTDEEIEQAVAEDPDAELLDAEWFRTAELVVPSVEKTRINIRLDEDIVAYFKEQGRGYQTRINDVLKAYVLSRRLKEQREALADGAEELPRHAARMQLRQVPDFRHLSDGPGPGAGYRAAESAASRSTCRVT